MGLAVSIGVLVAILASAVAFLLVAGSGHSPRARPHQPPASAPSNQGNLTASGIYFGLYVPGSPRSYAGLTSFSSQTRVKPSLAVYYSGWFEPFWARFAQSAYEHDAVPVVQMNPTNIVVSAISSGRYDSYIMSYARAVKEYRHRVVLSFGHEMNGQWYPWGYKHTSPQVFVAAWRHVVNLFRLVGARNVTWMWTVNAVERKGDQIPDPAAWWPGSSYVNWIGIDGYYHKRSSQFASIFGPTIVDVRELTKDPILISETGAAPNVDQPAKIASLFAGVRSYDLLGFVWFDAVGNADYRIISASAIDAFRLGLRANGTRP